MLERYSGIGSRYKCPRCGSPHSLTRYLRPDGTPYSDICGRCDHESGCGYDYTPAQYRADHSEENTLQRLCDYKPQPAPVSKALCTIPALYVARSMGYRSTFVRYLCELFDTQTIRRICYDYRIGQTKTGGVIFWQIDTADRVRTGKLMQYGADGHRVKGQTGAIDWAHARLKRAGVLSADWELTQCLFGEHLTTERPGAAVAVVESEKSAVICAGAFPQYVWIATGGISSAVVSKLQALRRKVVLFPDRDAVGRWAECAKQIPGASVSDLWQTIPADTLAERFGDRANTADIADLIAYNLTHTQPTPAEQMAHDWPAVADLINKLQMEEV